jgi:porin
MEKLIKCSMLVRLILVCSLFLFVADSWLLAGMDDQDTELTDEMLWELEEEVDYTVATEPWDEIPDFSKTKLTGDWGGARTDLANNGVTLDIDVLQSWQGVLSGGRDQSWKYGGSLDYWLNLDFEKMGLWEGGFLEMRAETQFGQFANLGSGTILGVNADGLFPLPEEHTTTLSHVVFTQFVSQNMGVFFGKMDTLDGDNNEFAGSRGKENFMNPGFIFNPVTLRTVPYSTMGGGVLFMFPDVLTPNPAILQFAVLGANGQPNTAGWDDDFEDGTVYTLEYSQPSNFFNLPGRHLFGGGYSNRDFALLDQNPRTLLEYLLGLGPLDEQEGSWSFYYNFHQYLFTEEEDPTQGFGIFGRYGTADEDTSAIHHFYSIGVGGKGIIEGRDEDRFGVGYLHVSLSDELPNFISPLFFDSADGVEVFYNIEVNPWLHITPDFQFLNASDQRLEDTYVAGVRVKVDI